MNNMAASVESLYSDKSTVSAPVFQANPEPVVHRPFTEEELNTLTRRTSKDLGDERLKQFLENHLHTDGEEDDDDVGQGINSGIPRRSLRSFRSRKKRHRSVKRARSMDPNIPNIIVTAPSKEDNRILKNASLYGNDNNRMVKVIHT